MKKKQTSGPTLPVQQFLDFLEDYPEAAIAHLTAMLGSRSINGLRNWLDDKERFPNCMALTAEHRRLYIIPAARAIYNAPDVREFAQEQWAELTNKRKLVDKGRNQQVTTLRRYYTSQLASEYTSLDYPKGYLQVTFKDKAENFQLLCTLQQEGTCSTQVILTCVKYADCQDLFMCFEPLPNTLTEMLLLKKIFGRYHTYIGTAFKYVYRPSSTGWIGSESETQQMDANQWGYDTMTIVPFQHVTSTWLPLLKETFSIQEIEWGTNSIE